MAADRTGRDAAGETISWQAAVRLAVEDTMRQTSVPGVIVAVARASQPPEFLWMGTDGAGMRLAEDSLFPVSSITKLATALAILRLAGRDAVTLDDPLARHIPEAAAARDDITVRMLLCHTAGLPVDLKGGAAPYAPGLDWPALARACLATRPVIPPTTRVHYSNIGSGLLAILVERLVAKPFAEAFVDLVLGPLGIEAYLGSEPPRPPVRVAGALGEHAGTDLEPYNSPFWRSLAMPWAGLVTTAAGALALVRAFAGLPGGFLAPDLLAEATRDQTGGLPGGVIGIGQWPRCPWGLGVELRGDKTPHVTPALASPDSFGHAGASGCLVWNDRQVGVSWAILGSRTAESWNTHWPAIGSAVLSQAPA
jgi:CubicO group peptidase (beta-lactamase class C family)